MLRCMCVCVCNNADSMKWQVVEERHFKLARDPPYFDVCGIEVHCHDPAKHARQRHSLISECWLWYLHVSIGHVQVHANHSDSKCFSIHFVTIHIAQCWPTLCHRFDSKGTAWPAINGYCAFANDANVVIAFATHVFLAAADDDDDDEPMSMSTWGRNTTSKQLYYATLNG